MRQGGERPNQQLVQREGNELRQNFEQLKRLFDLADKNLDPSVSFDQYVGHVKTEGLHPFPLPTELQNTVAAYPDDYFVVYYTNRNNSYYQKGTRGRTVGLSTAEHRSQSNERIREIEFKEPDPDDRDVNMYMTVREMVNEQSFAGINAAGNDEIEMPHGSATLAFVLRPDGTRAITGSRFNRLDEGMFDWGGSQKPVRWLRRLEIKGASDASPECVYEDSYIIGRNQAGQRDERAQVRTTVVGNLDNPQSIQVEIGIGGGVSGTLIFEDRERNIRVFMNDPIGSYAGEKEILQQDPNYGFILEGREFDVEKLLSIIRSKINLMQTDWDKSQPVFGEAIESGTDNQLPNS